MAKRYGYSGDSSSWASSINWAAGRPTPEAGRAAQAVRTEQLLADQSARDELFGRWNHGVEEMRAMYLSKSSDGTVEQKLGIAGQFLVYAQQTQKQFNEDAARVDPTNTQPDFRAHWAKAGQDLVDQAQMKHDEVYKEWQLLCQSQAEAKAREKAAAEQSQAEAKAREKAAAEQKDLDAKKDQEHTETVVPPTGEAPPHNDIGE